MAGATRRRQRGTIDHWPKTPDERIAAFRRIVDDKAYAKIDGTMIDMTTANIVVQIHDALNETNQRKFISLKAHKMAHVAFGLVSKRP